MEGESVLFIREEGASEARGSVLFPIDRVKAVRNSAGDLVYEEGRDYVWKRGSREIVVPAGSRIVSRTPADLRRPAGSQKYRLTHRDGDGEILFGARLEYHEMQTCVTYTHAPNLWQAGVPRFDSNALPRSVRKLRARQPLTIVVVGDSISAGCNASGWAGAPPFQPPYPELLQIHLENRFGASVHLRNLAVDGTQAHSVLGRIGELVQARPDLVVVAFGMNDAAGRPTSEYRANTEAIIAGLREKLPDVEFILIASMLGSPDWTRLQQPLFFEYRAALAGLCRPGIALADLTSIWKGFLELKRYWDLTGNGVNHPNDFGHRVYAQVLSTLLIPPR
jgi:lysophospholipase L1-like esterase